MVLSSNFAEEIKFNMKKVGIILSLALLLAGFGSQHTYSQGIFKKLKEKAEDKMVEKVFEEDKQTETGNETGAEGESDVYSTRPSNTRGGGLSKDAPDVNANLDEAETAYAGKKYGEARYSVRQAILGIELEIGEKILKDLPEAINGLPKVSDEDNVTSSGIGFVGLVIERFYRKDDVQLQVTIGNDAAMLSAANMYLASGAYASSQEDGYKQVKVGEYRGVLEYDEYSGYKLSIPVGQSSVVILEGVNFAGENEMMDAGNSIDLDKIKNELGEQ